MEKVWFKSRIVWTAFLGFVVTTATTMAPIDYKEIILSFEGLVLAFLTILFRWNSVPLVGFRKKK